MNNDFVNGSRCFAGLDASIVGRKRRLARAPHSLASSLRTSRSCWPAGCSWRRAPISGQVNGPILGLEIPSSPPPPRVC